MAVIIKCPECGNNVRVVTDGFVAMHFDHEGDLCPFVRTPHTDPPFKKPKVVEPPKPQQVPKKKAAPAPRVPQTRCPRCEAIVSVPGGQISAHIRRSGQWCSGGAKPTDSQRNNNAKKKRSVWTVSGGLPTLGRRRK